MKWSLRIGTLAGIGIYLHWTFLLVIGAIFFLYVAGGGLTAGLVGVGFILSIFGCIVLHELGHALTARRYGVETRDITLLPIGGMARLQRMPERPMQEFLVAIAGPMVNVVIAAVMALGLGLSFGWAALYPEALFSGEMLEGAMWLTFLVNVMWVNVALVVFNLLPAFPMDGGRMLRALLATRMSYSRATDIAASVGQMMAILFAFVGLTGFGIGRPNFILLFIALFVFLGAAAESRFAEIRTLLRDVPVGDAMIRSFRALGPDDSLSQAADELLAGMQPDFPVMEADGRYLGMLRRKDLAEGLKQPDRQLTVRDCMTTEGCPEVHERDMLDRVMTQMQEEGCSLVPVLDGERVIGIVTTENIGELMMIRSALGRNGRVDERHLQGAA